MNTVVKELSPEKPVVETGVTAEKRMLDSIFGKRPTEFQLAVMVEQGLPISSVEVLRNEGLTFSEVHGVVLPARTLKHRKNKKQSITLELSSLTLHAAKL